MSATYDSIINIMSARYSLPPKLIKAVIQAESNFNPNAQSGAGAQGLMQLMPATANSLGVKNVFDPYENIEAGTKYLAQQIKAFGSIELGLAAYNAGAGNVRKYGGIPPFTETQNYVKKVMNLAGETSVTTGASDSFAGTGILSLLSSPVPWLGMFAILLFKR